MLNRVVLVALLWVLGGCGVIESFYPSPPTTLEYGARPEPSSPVAELEPGSESRAIVIYNADVSDSKEIANYYAEKRGIPSHLLSAVHVPNSLFGNPDDLLSVRRQILENTLCPFYAAGETCNAFNFDALLRAKNLPSHLVFIKGIPMQLRDTGWAGSTNATPFYQSEDNRIQPTSFDFYLAHALLNERATCTGNQCFAGENSNGLGFFDVAHSYSRFFKAFQRFNPTGYYQAELPLAWGKAPKLNPSVHRAFAYGRVEGVTLRNTLDLIDKTLDAEKNGIDGNFFGSRYEFVNLAGVEYVLAELTGSLASECMPAAGSPSQTSGTVYPVPGNPSCRVQFNQQNIPVSAGGNVHSVTKAIGFFGQDAMTYYGNFISQYGFAGDFAKMLGWRRTTEACAALCVNAPDPDTCRATTFDPFKTINSACVGVEPGFIGHQYRSFPVQHMGVYPKQWKTVSMGPATATPPTLEWTGGVQDGYFTDERYIHFGDLNYRRSENCFDRNGAQKDCDPKVEIYATRVFDISPGIQVGASPQSFSFSFYWKGYTAREGRVTVLMQLLTENNQVAYEELIPVSLIGEQSDWKQISSSGVLSSSTVMTVNRMKVLVYSATPPGFDPDFNTSYNREPVYGYFALDGIRGRMGGTDLVSADAGGFNEDYTDNHTSGSFAADMIGRLGATAFWGSGSHFATGGGSFVDSKTIVRSFFSGATLGESLLYDGSGISGHVFGDPLYQPQGVALSLEPSLFRYGGPLAQKDLNLTWQDLASESPTMPSANTVIVTPSSAQSVREAPLFFDAWFGRLENIHYRIELCAGETRLSNCAWKTLTKGSGTAHNQVVPGTETGLFNLAQTTGYHFVRIKVFPVGEEQRGLSRYVKFFFIKSSGNIPPLFALSQARLQGSGWNEEYRDDSSINSFLTKTKFYYGDNNRLIIECNRRAEIFGFPCSQQHWELTTSYTSGTTPSIPSHTRVEEMVPVTFGSAVMVRRTTFIFDSNLPECNKYNFVLQSPAYRIHFTNQVLCPYDFNDDGVVSQADFIEFRNRFGMDPGYLEFGNFNADGAIDQKDMIKFRNYFGFSVNP